MYPKQLFIEIKTRNKTLSDQGCAPPPCYSRQGKNCVCQKQGKRRFLARFMSHANDYFSQMKSPTVMTVRVFMFFLKCLRIIFINMPSSYIVHVCIFSKLFIAVITLTFELMSDRRSFMWTMVVHYWRTVHSDNTLSLSFSSCNYVPDY